MGRAQAGASANRVRPGLRFAVLGGSAALIVVMAISIAVSVSSHLRESASASAARSVDAIVRGFIDPIFTPESLDLGATVDPQVTAQLARLVASPDMRRINIWTRDGRAMYSTDETIAGQRLDIGHELATAFAGHTTSEFGDRASLDGPATDIPDVTSRCTRRSAASPTPTRSACSRSTSTLGRSSSGWRRPGGTSF